jgi:hypothetical protein
VAVRGRFKGKTRPVADGEAFLSQNSRIGSRTNTSSAQALSVSQQIVEGSRAAALNEAASIGLYNPDIYGSGLLRFETARIELIRYCE